jgi:hypothetical protein
MSNPNETSAVSKAVKGGQVIDFLSTGIFALVIGMTLVQWLLPTLPGPMVDTVTLSTAKAIVGLSIAALIVPFAYLSVRMLSEFATWLGQHTPKLKTQQS